MCQMLTNTPTAAVHTYDPRNDPGEAAELRASFEHEESDFQAARSATPPPTTPPPAKSDSDSSDEGSPSPPPRRAAVKTPRQRGQQSSVNIHFSPSVAVRMNSGTVLNYAN